MSLINDALKRAQAEKPRDAQSAAPVPPLEPVVAEPAKSPSFVPWAAFLIGVGALAVAGGLWFKSRVPAQQQAAPSAQSELATTAPVSVQPEGPQQTAGALVANQPAAPENIVAASTPSSAAETASVTPATPTPASPVAAAPIPRDSSPALAAAPLAQIEPSPSPVPVQEPIQSTKVAATGPAPTPAETKSPAAPAPAANVATAEPAPLRAPNLQAIYYRLRGPTVVINGKTLRVGESVDGAKVISIQRTSVEVFQNGEYQTLTLKD